MENYMVIAEVNSEKYLTKVTAGSLGGAEHRVLGLAVCGKHTYGVTGCQAFATADMKYETFISEAINANPVSFEELEEIIAIRNAEIKRRDEAEDRLNEIRIQIELLKQEEQECLEILGW